MERIKKQRTTKRSATTRIINEVEAELAKEDPNHTLLRVKLQKLTSLRTELTELDQGVKDIMLDEDCTEQLLEDEEKVMEEYENKIIATKLNIEDVISPNSPTSSSIPSVSSTASGEGRSSYKLPKIELSKFGGDVREWLGWWAQFSGIHTDDHIPTNVKFQYLVQGIVPDSRAHAVIKIYPRSDDNYPLVIAALKKRFGNEKILRQLYIRELLGMVMKSKDSGEKKMSLSTLHDQLKGKLTALESLGKLTDPNELLYPLVESCLPNEVLIAWQRSPLKENKLEKGESELGNLMTFLEKEVEGEEERCLARNGLDHMGKKKGNGQKGNEHRKGESVHESFKYLGLEDIPTAAGLTASTPSKNGCTFCDKSNHTSQDCFKARNMSLEQKEEKLREKKACYRCFKTGHNANKCKVAVKCFGCGKNHHLLMCRGGEKKETPPEQLNLSVTRHNNFAKSQDVLLKVVVVRAVGPNGSSIVRMLIDEGSQVSYIGARTVNITGSKITGVEHVKNILLGGYVTNLHEENLREVVVKNLLGNIEKKWILREKPIVCTSLPRIPKGPWVDRLKDKNISLSDLDTVHVDQYDVEILIGSDLRGQVMTGRRSELGDGLYAEETIFGWALGGPLKSAESNHINTVISLFQSQFSVQDMWSLDILGIQDPIQVKTKIQEEDEAKTHFQTNVTRNGDGRYCVGLPWIYDRPELPNNKYVAEKRLQATTKRLKDQQAVGLYDNVFRGWEEEKIVEPVTIVFKEDQGGHYLPHRPVFKPESQTTPVRPVFDASCKSVGKPSLNDCLYKGPNLIELIPAVLHRFRERRIGVVSDIRKAFQMIEVRKEDRDYQKFLWWENQGQTILKPLRHTRVVFGLTCSPFLLGAVLELHLSQVKKEDKSVAQKLLKSMYVDNSVTSFDTVQEYEEFRENSIRILSEAKMDLRQWECSNVNVDEDVNTGVLGLLWDRREDTLSCDVPPVVIEGPLTKRKILSVVAKLFDPIGFLCPATLQPKVLLQEMWRTDKGWDDEVEEKHVSKFKKWCEQINLLSEIKIPRRMMLRPTSSDTQLHLFTDASRYAYAAVIYIRSEREEKVEVQLVQAKSRVAPLKGGTIPRLELMGCLIGVRLLSMVREALDIKIDREVHWTDSTTALAWIQRGEEWGTFVANRVLEIRKSTSIDNWRHVPGIVNPADLPSRGCSPSDLIKSKWWEGPDWLKRPEEEWPSITYETDEDEIRKECKGRKRTIMQIARENSWFHCKFSFFPTITRVVGWIIRFVTNCRKDKTKREIGARLNSREIKVAEYQIFRSIQQDCLRSDIAELSKKLAMVERNGLLCLKTRLLNKEDSEHFRWPIILPSDHYLVIMMVKDLHKSYSHPGVQFLICKLRESFWILGGRKAIKKIVRGCPSCRRHDAKPLTVEPAALPANRVTPGEVFETTGVDLAGPVILKDGSKMWIVLFTCSVYRCVSFDVVTSISTEAFMGAMQRFINFYGRPRTFCSDNGTNFVGVGNLLKTLQWEELLEKFDVASIKWTFNPPSAPWWGGWWERLVRSMKNQLRRMLGKAKLTCEELRTCLSAVQATINDRPLTVVTEDSGDLMPLTPSMFLHPSRNAHFPEGGIVSQRGLELTYKKMISVQSQLQQRFRSEYLAQLIQRGSERKAQPIKIGDVVLIGADNKKRYQWPLGRVVDLIPGRDGKCRVAKVQTAHDYELKKGRNDRYSVTKVKKGHVFARPLQRLYPLEISSATDLPELQIDDIKRRDEKVPANIPDPVQAEVMQTRFGRQVKKPTRYSYWIHECSCID